MNQRRHPGNATAVRARGLTRSFRSGEATVVAVNGVDLDVETRTLTLVVGPSGCGKTTLLSLIAGVLDPDSGSVEVYDNDWQRMGSKRRTIKRGELVGFVFQDFNLVPTLTALENAAIPALIKGASRGEAEASASEMLDSVGLGDRLGALPRELSGGMMQRVSIARALVADPALLVCDEPTANLDAKTGRRVMEQILDLRKQKTDDGMERAVIAVTHDRRIFEMADVIHEMEDGGLVGQRGPEPESGEEST